jgi:hypothetical protein
MSIALIEESAKETRRLAIAGSPLAAGDFRLKKLLAPLEQAGAKVPVFGQVAKAIGDLVNGTEAESAERLLALSTLLNAILYTQGQTGAEGNFTGLEVIATNCSSTRTSARALKPLIAALTNAGAGRFEIVKSACEAGAFNDLRLLDPAIHALGDSYSELADLAAEKILPGYGPGILPRLKAGFNLKGAKPDARKLKLMHRLDPAGTLALCQAALDEGAPEVKAAAIACLGKHEECFALVLEQASSRNKTVRAAALEALAEHDRPEIVKLFNELLKGKALDILARPFRAIRNREVVNSLLEEGKRVFSLVLKGEVESVQRFAEILDCLTERKDAEIEGFLLACFDQSPQPGKRKAPKASPFTASVSAADLMDRLGWLLYGLGSAKALEAILAKRELLSASAFTLVLQSALQAWSPDKIYQEFAPLLQQKSAADKAKCEMLQHWFRTSCGADSCDSPASRGTEDIPEAGKTAKIQWDPRWLDAAIKADQQFIVCCLAKPGHTAAIDYLLKVPEMKNRIGMGLVVRALAQCGHPKITDLFLDLVTKKTKGANYFDYELQLLFQSARHLPPADLPKLDAFAAKLDEKFVDRYLLALEPLRPANQPNQG